MSFIDKNIQFVVEHYEEILSLKKILEHTEKTLPDLLNGYFRHAANEMGKFFDQKGLHLELDVVVENTCYWYDPKIYDNENEIGLFFSFDHKKWDYIFDEGTPDIDTSAKLYVGLDTEECSKKRKEALFNKIIKKISNQYNLKALKTNKIRICKDFYIKNPRILEYNLAHDINMKTIKNSKNLTLIIQNAIKRFTSSTHPIIRGLNGKLRVK
jgi:hypothetical protein